MKPQTQVGKRGLSVYCELGLECLVLENLVQRIIWGGERGDAQMFASEIIKVIRTILFFSGDQFVKMGSMLIIP